MAWTAALVLSLLSLSRLTISASLPAMLGQGARAAAATQRITTGFQSGDDLFVVAEVRAPEAGPINARFRHDAERELVAFGERFTASIHADPAAQELVAFVRIGLQGEIARYVRDRVLPNAAYFLTEPQFEAALKKLSPEEIREQISRNESMIGAAGTAAAALSKQILRDPLRLFELAGLDADSGLVGPDRNGRPQFEPPAPNSTTPASPNPPSPELSSDGSALLIRMGSVEPSNNLDVARQLTDLAAIHASRANTTNLRVRLGGPAPIAASAARVIRQDAIWSTLVSVALVAMLFAIFYHRWAAALLIGGAACTGMLVGVGTLAWFLQEVSPLGIMIAALLVGLGTDYGIHFLSHYDGARAEGLGSVQAAARSAQEMAIPIATTCLTCIFGFASLWPSDIKMLSDFAALGAAGLLGALIAVFTLLPVVLALVDGKATRRLSGVQRIGKVADGIARWPRTCMAVCGVALIATVLAAAGQGFALRLEPDISVMHPQPNPALDATRFVMERFGGLGELVPIEVTSQSPDGLVAAAHDAANAIAAANPPVPGLMRVAGLHQLVPDPRTVPDRVARLAAFDASASLEAFDRAIDESAFDPAAYTGYRSFLAAILSARQPPTIVDVIAVPELAQGLFPRAPTGISMVPTDRTVIFVSLEGPLADRAQRSAAVTALTAAVKDLPGVTIAGLVAVSEEFQTAVQTGLPRSVAISVALVLLWLLIVFRHPLDVLLALVPLVLAGGSTVLFMSAARLNFNPINSVAIPLLDGIAVDAGIFLVAAARAHGADRAAFVSHLRVTTHAIILAASTTFTAFLSLCISHTPAIRSLGLVASVGIATAFVAVLLLLMPILILRARPSAIATTSASSAAA
jgi:hypothetical protein